MKPTIYYLGTCNTCKKIIAELGAERLEHREIKADPLTPAELDALKKLAGSYEALFSRRSQQIKQRGLDVSTFTEQDFRAHILEHYSFLKRPVVVAGGEVFIGNAKATVAAAKAALG